MKSEVLWRNIATDMDALDIRIVEALQRRGDLTHAELAETVNSTSSTCLRRVRVLQESGVLTANVYVADAARLGRPVMAVITATTKENTRADREKLASCIRAEPSISCAWGVTGEVDAVLFGHFRDMAEYQEVCDRIFDDVGSVVRYTTHFVSETYKSETAISVDVVQSMLD